ncbi:MAG TPA: hypothetical protein VKV18_15815, partial [Chthonomonas sp.]|uniref:hypothetical protein n=1 Tax=Chthonomonas sp. TaxID=2282153 RepID=UPI002B4B45CD
MPLFPAEAVSPADAPARMRLTRELGTRRLLTIFVALLVIWYVAGQIQDHILLSRHWPPLQPDLNGLTVVGALNPHTDYDRNYFKIFTENTASRVCLTEYGWNSIFDPRNGPMCSPEAAGAIKAALQVNDRAGYAMLAPYIRAAVRFIEGDKNAFKEISPNQIITVQPDREGGKPTTTTLAALIKKYSGNGDSDLMTSTEEEGNQSASGRSVEDVITLTPDVAAETLPVVLTGKMFTSAQLEEQPPTLLVGPSYTVSLHLTPEGR